eukprot:TRINITY_DN9422_c0_g1_i1.p1 TRINITY_DN9422_c0_g1~~TRINITY_DN9422_c0_g1_i1.p1  ORF type:complete len:168 (-),score=29.02 TRINITY_DN9422_c0_g1_i1:137-640(-)
MAQVETVATVRFRRDACDSGIVLDQDDTQAINMTNSSWGSVRLTPLVPAADGSVTFSLKATEWYVGNVFVGWSLPGLALDDDPLPTGYYVRLAGGQKFLKSSDLEGVKHFDQDIDKTCVLSLMYSPSQGTIQGKVNDSSWTELFRGVEPTLEPVVSFLGYGDGVKLL